MAVIRTPADLIGYLRAVALQHGMVQYVTHGDEFRAEEATQARSRYPLVDIELPVHTFPVGQQPTTISTTIRIADRAGRDDHAEQDLAHDRAYRIAVELLAIIRTHAADDDWGFSMRQPVEIRPIVSMLSDQLRGWQLDITVDIDQDHCIGHLPVDPDDIAYPAFTWANADTNPAGIHVTVTAAGVKPGALNAGWYWAEATAQPTPSSTIPGPGIDLAPITGAEFRHVDIWYWIELADGRKLWAYARADSRLAGGRSTPFAPYLPA